MRASLLGGAEDVAAPRWQNPVTTLAVASALLLLPPLLPLRAALAALALAVYWGACGQGAALRSHEAAFSEAGPILCA
jgi:hypothetical protein